MSLCESHLDIEDQRLELTLWGASADEMRVRRSTFHPSVAYPGR